MELKVGHRRKASADLLVDIEYEVEHRRRKPHAEEAEDLVVQGECFMEVGKAEEPKAEKNEAGEDDEPLPDG